GGRGTVQRGGLPAQGRIRGGSGVRTGAGRDRALDPLQRREEARGVPREERPVPGDRRRRRAGVPGADAGQPAAGGRARAGRGVPGHARAGARGGRGLTLPTPSPRDGGASRTLGVPPQREPAMAHLLLPAAVLVTLACGACGQGPEDSTPAATAPPDPAATASIDHDAPPAAAPDGALRYAC